MDKLMNIFNDLKKVDDFKIFQVNSILEKELENFTSKIIVLDDDPTGVQTVNNIYLYTNWDEETIIKGFLDSNRTFYILTNSRSFDEETTKTVHKEIANTIEKVSNNLKIDYLLISRSDSTLRGHYPLETETLKNEIEQNSSKVFDGEILCPYFDEGGRYTINDIHYVKMGDSLVPTGETEFAKDSSFGYSSSNLLGYIEEKSRGKFTRNSIISIGLDELRRQDFPLIEEKLMMVSEFNKIIINAVTDYDLSVFCIALLRAIKNGKNFLFRTAASFVRVLSGIKKIDYLSKKDFPDNISEGGLVVIGSHTKKTTDQLQTLESNKNFMFFEINTDLVRDSKKIDEEIERVLTEEEKYLKEGKNVVLYTKRKEINLLAGEDPLDISVKISMAVVETIKRLKLKPKFILAKGGITSSDILTKALQAKRALVLGQIIPGVPVVKIEEGFFRGVPYIIFPGNVGDVSSLETALKRII